ncbi:triacylglycerol lipase SDP1-like [Wolffia australiana]
MRCALTYEDWGRAAAMLEKEAPRSGDGALYDEELIRSKLIELRHRRRNSSLKDMAFFLRSDLFRNLGNMCNPKLLDGRLQVPKLVDEYITEVSGLLKMISKSNCEEFTVEERLDLVQETRHAFGRTALVLSGGSTLAAFHLGVVKVLVDHKLLPRVLAGSSAGSIISAVIATKSRAEIASFFDNSLPTVKFFDRLGGAMAVFRRVMTRGAIHDIRHLQRLMMEMTQCMTFQEAFDRTGRVLAITVCSARNNEPARCLNHLTAPNVLIWSAVTASCAFPGLFEAQQLMSKDREGNVVPYQAPLFKTSSAPPRRWRDGSLESDLPMIQLKELFNVNHFIVSQTNPHIAPWLRVKEIVRGYAGDFPGKLANVFEMEVKHRFSQLLELGFPLRGLTKLFTQDWEGDITIVMPATLAQYSKIIVNPSYMELKMALNQGSRRTWEKLSAIRATCAIEFALDECFVRLDNAQRRPSLPMKKIPTFFEEDILADSLPSPKADGQTALWKTPQDRNTTPRRLAKFVQELDIASVKATPSLIKDKMASFKPNSLLLAEGDLLQPEKIENGFVLSVVKKEDYVLTPKPGNFDECRVLYPETGMGSSSSECGDEDEAVPIDREDVPKTKTYD